MALPPCFKTCATTTETSFRPVSLLQDGILATGDKSTLYLLGGCWSGKKSALEGPGLDFSTVL